VNTRACILVTLLFLTTTAHAENKSATFMQSCEATLVRIMTLRKPENKAEIPKLAQSWCTDMTSMAITSTKRKWDSIPDHKREGCMYAVFFLNKEASQSGLEKANAHFCE
jgi:hypothetical protein